MKKLFVAMMLMPLMTLADTEMVDGIVWTYVVYDGKVQVGSGSLAIPQETTGAITVPSTLGGKPVARIGYRAFEGCTGLASIEIPKLPRGKRDYQDCYAITLAG